MSWDIITLLPVFSFAFPALLIWRLFHRHWKMLLFLLVSLVALNALTRVIWASRSHCFGSSSCHRILSNIVIYFVSQVIPSAAWEWGNIAEESMKEHCSSFWLLAGNDSRRNRFNTSLNANQLFFRFIFQVVYLTPSSCSSQTELHLVQHTAVQLVLRCFPFPVSTQGRESFLLQN